MRSGCGLQTDRDWIPHISADFGHRNAPGHFFQSDDDDDDEDNDDDDMMTRLTIMMVMMNMMIIFVIINIILTTGTESLIFRSLHQC